MFYMLTVFCVQFVCQALGDQAHFEKLQGLLGPSSTRTILLCVSIDLCFDVLSLMCVYAS